MKRQWFHGVILQTVEDSREAKNGLVQDLVVEWFSNRFINKNIVVPLAKRSREIFFRRKNLPERKQYEFRKRILVLLWKNHERNHRCKLTSVNTIFLRWYFYQVENKNITVLVGLHEKSIGSLIEVVSMRPTHQGDGVDQSSCW